uniref:Uncharacterized protein ycf33 n=1 Tax=Dipterosiphonia australica TaxID=2007208 RepID=A0A1Z1MLU7_9FLOR|nr:hypothetical protein [Dipterosiphonia australica]ARW66906.1 hypothetical protein [Dipterosiphonia australica]
MSDFWVNLYKFPRFLINVLIGFFLTTFKPIFKLLENKNNRFIFTIILMIIMMLSYKIIYLMTGIE